MKNIEVKDELAPSLFTNGDMAVMLVCMVAAAYLIFGGVI